MPSPPFSTRATVAAIAAACLAVTAARADVRITLDDSFIARNQDRATLAATFTVEKTQAGPAAPTGGGTLRAAGRAPEIGLPTVITLLTAAQRDAVALLERAEHTGEPLAVRGVWRLWCSEGGDAQQTQGQAAAPADTANPAHVFELRPLLQAGDRDVTLRTLRATDGWVLKDAAQAFQRYEQLSSHLTTGDGTTTITTRMAGSEPFVEFVLRLNEAPRPLADGLAVHAALLDTDGETLVADRRIVAVAGTPAYDRLKTLRKGNALHVVGTPRIDLSQVAWRLAHAADVPGILDWSLPYELVLVSVFDDTPAGPDILPPGAPTAADAATPGGSVLGASPTGAGTREGGASGAAAGSAATPGALLPGRGAFPADSGSSGAPPAGGGASGAASPGNRTVPGAAGPGSASGGTAGSLGGRTVPGAAGPGNGPGGTAAGPGAAGGAAGPGNPAAGPHAATGGAPDEPTTEMAIANPPDASAPAGSTEQKPDADVVTTLLQLLARETPPDAPRGACILSSEQKSYCAILSAPQCDQLGGAWNADTPCPPAMPGVPAPAAPAATPPPDSATPPAAGTASPPDVTTPPDTNTGTSPPPGGGSPTPPDAGSPTPADTTSPPDPGTATQPPPDTAPPPAATPPRGRR